MTCLNCKSFFKIILLTLVSFLLNGCNSVLLNPQGTIAIEESSLILISFIMMLFVIVPVIFMTIYFSLKYRSTNINEIYKPNWCHSKRIEIVVWSIPVIIVSILALLTWHYSHKLDPKKSIVSFYDPIKIDVVSLDWKWLFIYPDYHIGTINEIMLPVNRPIVFRITSNSVMNSFFIPSLGSQVYAMPGMITKLNLISNNAGKYKGISSNYSGSGFSQMKFNVISVSKNSTFIDWINKIKNSSNKLNNMQIFNSIAMPNESYSIEYFSDVKKNLFEKIINQFSLKQSKIIKNQSGFHRIMIQNVKVEK